MTEADFPTFFADLHGYPPFRWQTRLLKHIVAKGWPDVIHVPTGCGKTAVIDIAVFLLALDSSAARRRVFFVVDRRLVVDQAAERARRITDMLSAGATETLRKAADRLLEFGGDQPLVQATLRGGLEHERPWCDNPAQPTVAVSTVDQLGSRLLFQAYGCSRSRRPIEAGLAGTGSLVIVDEAHISRPFLDTLERLQKHGADVMLTQMSATTRTNKRCFKWNQKQDLKDELIRLAVTASKAARLQETDDVVKAAITAAKASPGPVVGIILNTVASARRVLEGLDGDKVLLIGRVRPTDREAVLDQWLPLIAADRLRNDRRLYCVSTQSIEVGADVDFDSLVCEAAPLDVLRQRFGRLDRRGALGSTQAVVVCNPQRNFPAYGEATLKTWRWLHARAKKTGTVDFGIIAFEEAWAEYPASGLVTESPGAPVLLPSYLDAWEQTQSSEVPDASPFLHGPDAQDSDEVQLVWRADLETDWSEAASAAPPISREAMPVPVRTVKGWLAGRAKAGLEHRVLLWRGLDDVTETSRVSSIRPGDTVIVPSRYGGSDEFGWAPRSLRPVPDVGNLVGRWRRIHPSLCEDGPAKEKVAELAPQVRTRDGALNPAAIEKMAKLAGLGDERIVATRLYPGGVSLRISGRGADRRKAAGRPVILQTHSEGVERWARRFASCCGLDPGAIETIAAAARHHDLGKADDRFQVILHGGRLLSAVRAIECGKLLAKSGTNPSPTEAARIARIAGYPKGARHEATSVKLAERLDRPDAELHLIAAHHGHGRPWLPCWEDSHEIFTAVDGQKVSASAGGDLGLPDSPAPERFLRLSQLRGRWSLAFLETVLRLADHRQSALEMEDNFED